MQPYNLFIDDRYFGMNVHCLVHLPDGVVETGPLWVNSMFAFESLNGVVAASNHSNHVISKSAMMQYVNAQDADGTVKRLQSKSAIKFCKTVKGLR